MSFLKNACQKFGKLLMILDGAPQHKARVVRDALGELNGQVNLLFLPAGCPDLSATEELWRQMETVVLVGPYVKFKKTCSDIDEWLDRRLPSLDTYRYVYRSIQRRAVRPAGVYTRGFCAQPCRIRRRWRIKPA